MAIQLLYQFDFYEQKIALMDLKKNLLSNYALEQGEEPSDYHDKISDEFLDALLLVLKNIEAIDTQIVSHLKSGWTIDKLPDVMLQALRLAAFELKFMNETPLKVIIDEYVDIAACFFDSKKLTFINSILENLAKNFREEEYREIKGL